MAVKSRSLRHILPIALFLTLTPLLYGQTAAGVEHRFLQRLSWVGDGYAFRYEVIVEKAQDGDFTELLREITPLPHIDVSLAPGSYRYRVIPYDFLDRPGPESENMGFEVLPALDPEPRFINRLAWAGDEYVRYFEVEIEREGYVGYRPLLREITTLSFIEISLSPGNYRYRIIPYDYLDHPGPETEWVYIQVLAFMPEAELVAEIEPEIKDEPVRIIIQRNFDIYLGAFWMPLIPIYGEHPLYDREISITGAALRLGLVYPLSGHLSPGFEIAASLHEFPDNLRYLSVNLNLLLQRRMATEKTALNLRLGAGLSGLLEDREDRDGAFLDRHFFNINMGLSFLWMPLRHFFVETGFDYAHLLGEDQPGCIRPWIGIGLKF